MTTPLIARLLLDAQDEFARAANAVPETSRDTATAGLNVPGWIVAHTAAFLDFWINVDARWQAVDDGDPWLGDWFRKQESPGETPVEASYVEARSALDRVLERTRPFVAGLSEDDLARVPPGVAETGWPEGTTVGYLVARSIAHVFAHAAELNAVATAAGAPDAGLPGRLIHTAETAVD